MAGLLGRAMAEEATAARPAVRRIGRGTEQQLALWGELVNGDRHVVCEARAGCGKSSSCREGMWRMLEHNSTERIRYLVFNKANADEFRQHCPPLVEVATSHSIGYQALRKAFPKASLEKNKTYLVLDGWPDCASMPRYLRKAVATTTGYAKNHALDPNDSAIDARVRDLVLHYDVKTYGRTDAVVGTSLAVLRKSADWTDVVDFDDMIWLPGLLGLEFDGADTVFLDEVQDWNAAQHAMIPLMTAGSSRVVGVGDSLQAINAFRGADQDSMDNLRGLLAEERRGLAQVPLTITFRCPQRHVRMANAYAPDLVAHESAPEGEVGRSDMPDMVRDVRPGDLVICPTNAPVIAGCLKLLAERRPAYVRGRAVGDQLAMILRGLPPSRTVADAARHVEAWRGKELSRLSQLDGVEDLVESVGDRANGLQAILSACSSPSEAEPLLASLFSDERRDSVTTFSSVHRAKGDEADTVWLIEAPQRTPTRPWQARQQANLQYVALTRSKNRLVFVEPPVRDASDSER